MVEVKWHRGTVDLPYTLYLHGVTEEMFDELVDEDTKAELRDGVMIVHSPASLRHDELSAFIRTLMSCYAEEEELGDVLGPDSLIHLATCRKFAPDVYFLERDNLPQPLPAKEYEGAPALVVEVLSPSNRGEDLKAKRSAYRAAGVKEIWLVDPDKQQVILDHQRRKGYATTIISEGRVSSKALAGFWLDTAWLWAEPLPKVLGCLRKILRKKYKKN